jgi:hypothetical protein
MTINYKTNLDYSFVEEGFAITSDDIIDLSQPFELTDELLDLFLQETPKKLVTRTKQGKYPLWIWIQIKPVNNSKLRLVVEYDKTTNEQHLTKGHRKERGVTYEDLKSHLLYAQQISPNKPTNFRFTVTLNNIRSVWGKAYSVEKRTHVSTTKLQLVTIYPLTDQESEQTLEETLKDFDVVKSDVQTFNETPRKHLSY